MRAVVVFSNESRHPLRRLLREGFRHCFLVVQQHNDSPWVLVDSCAGLPYIAIIGVAGFDVEQFYQRQGMTTVTTWQRRAAPRLPCTVASCVGMTKAVLGIEAPLVQTPHGLYQYLLRRPDA